MADIQRVSCGQMKRDAQELQTELKNIPKIIEQLEASMNRLAQCWEGPAWTAFQNQVSSDIQNMNKVYRELKKLQKGLGQGRETYLRTEFDVYTDLKLIF